MMRAPSTSACCLPEIHNAVEGLANCDGGVDVDLHAADVGFVSDARRHHFDGDWKPDRQAGVDGLARRGNELTGHDGDVVATQILSCGHLVPDRHRIGGSTTAEILSWAKLRGDEPFTTVPPPNGPGKCFERYLHPNTDMQTGFVKEALLLGRDVLRQRVHQHDWRRSLSDHLR